MKPKRNYVPGPLDDCQTPGYGLEPLLHVIKKPDIRVWECAFGEGLLANALESERFMYVFETGLKGNNVMMQYKDFLKDEPLPDSWWDCIITNPPYSLKKQFTTRCYELGKPWALLMPTETVSTKWFIELAKSHDPKPGIIWFSPRINFKMPKKGWDGDGAQFPVAWYTWNMDFEGNMFLRMDHWNKEYRKRFEV